MIVAVRWCEARMTLFHHLKLKRPRMHSNHPDPPMSPSPRRKGGTPPIGNGDMDKQPKTDTKFGFEVKGIKEEPPDNTPPQLEARPVGTPDEDNEAMPQLERQNSVFDGGGVANIEGRDQVLPDLSPQLWPSALSYHRATLEDPVPPPLLMGDVMGRGKTMVWANSSPVVGGVKRRIPPSSTITSPVSKKTPSPTHTPVPSSPTATSPQFEASSSLHSLPLIPYRVTPPTSVRSSASASKASNPESGESEDSAPLWPVETASPDTQALNLCLAASTSRVDTPREDDGQSMVCMICEDRATGLHYGIITCEGCKGFFKRTVQNKRVYTCVAEGGCEVTKAQRNRCQYCRFQKCVRQGMVLAAVREDRMPGGRNSGAVYNLYKVKYKKHRRGQKNGHIPPDQQQQSLPSPSRFPASINPQQPASPADMWPSLGNGRILKAALTSPAAATARPRPDSVTSSGRMTPDQAMRMIRQLVDVDTFEEVARLKNTSELLQTKQEMNDKMCNIADNIVYKLVQWTKRLPFYNELPVHIHTELLTHKWQELLVLTSCAFLAIRGAPPLGISQSISQSLRSLKEGLSVMVGEEVGFDELEEAAPLVEKLARLADTFRRMNITIEEYVCLKVIIMETSDEYKDQKELENIRDRYLQALRVFAEHRFPQHPTRYSELLACIPEVRAAAHLVVQSKMFYVPLFLNTSLKGETVG